MDTTRIASLRQMVEAGLRGLVAAHERGPNSLYAPVRYVLEGTGKRLRPIVLLLVAQSLGVRPKAALPAALAVEVFHTFTLVHDDVMDHADERRGRPTVHQKWDENTAILCGDYLMGLSYDLLARLDTPHLARIIRTFHRMVARLCEGQALDEHFETRRNVSVPEYLGMIGGKTGALLELALELGGLLGDAPESMLADLRESGAHLGRAFQIQDDLLDLTANPDRWGKPIGADLIEAKRAYLLLRALQVAEGETYRWFERILSEGGLPTDEVAEARRRMDALGILTDTRAEVVQAYTRGLAGLQGLPDGPARDALFALIQQMQERAH